MSSISQTKAEAQKLIKLYNKLQAEAKTVDSVEAARKVAEAEKLVSQIHTLQSAINKTKVQEAATKKAQESNKTTTFATKNEENQKRTLSEEERKIALEGRINRIEDAQKKTRIQIEQLNRAKAELSRLQVEAEKNAEVVVQGVRVHDEERVIRAQELTKLTEQIQSRDTQYQSLKNEFDTVRQQAQKDTDLLREQRDTAVEKQKQLEKEKLKLLRYGGSSYGFLNGLLIGVGIGIFCFVTLVIVITKTSWLDEVVCNLKGSTSCSFYQSSTTRTSRN
ncbi:hypothetical protein [Candidatus Parabeggiatoa sp. HSG14]|uniref:hypothetical protein n=1 Tax=Candidatus Parabeggiatoa sp. HSG14 TaxID=3055593 RepID=UPI0025A751E2|nr:hypothetical protein [Thiotrichales bacterium HSG14]